MTAKLNKSQSRLLRELANAYGIQTSYYNISHKRKSAADDSLLAVLDAIGKTTHDKNTLPTALYEFQRKKFQQKIEPVIVAWDGELSAILIQLDQDQALAKVNCCLTHEDGTRQNWDLDLAKLPALTTVTFASAVYITKAIEFSAKIPFGYHSLSIKSPTFQVETFIISAPRHMSAKNSAANSRGCGLFIPIYALHSERSLGCGDLTDFKNFISWAASCGLNLISTLPLHAAFLDEPFEISPYSPVSRLFWNELYLDITQIEEFIPEELPSAEERAALNAGDYVDYKLVEKTKRQILTKMLARCLANETRRRALNEFLQQHPQLSAYAAFRAHMVKTGTTWRNWPANERSGMLPEQTWHDENFYYHAYVQWQIHLQMQGVLNHAKENGVMLYLDSPLGVHKDGFDTWYFQEEFPETINIGAAPDPGYINGQNWGIVPLHPLHIRQRHYRYFIQSLRTILDFVDILRLDHVMWLHRLYWIPENFSATQGVYVHYPTEELYAILCLEAARHNVVLIGENLGTVPKYINTMLKKHHFLSMQILQYEIDMGYGITRKFPKNSIISLNTHDMFPFASYYQNLDLEEKLHLKLINDEIYSIEKNTRKNLLGSLSEALEKNGFFPSPEHSLQNTLYGCFYYLATTPPRFFLINLEDLWFETRPQNIPSISSTQHRGWQKRTRLSLEEFTRHPDITTLLAQIVKIRNEGLKLQDYLKTLPVPEPVAQLHDEYSLLTANDLHLFNEGRHFHIYRKLGAHYVQFNGQNGVYFAVWAPNAKFVSVIGNFNQWNRYTHPLTPRESSGIWEGFVPNIYAGEIYKYFIESHYQGYQVEKTDPVGFYHEVAPRNASIVNVTHYKWKDQQWMKKRYTHNNLHAPISIYELHLGSWRRMPEEGNRYLTYREMAPYLADYIKQQGYTHVEFMPIMEHPYYQSWGYQITGYFAPTSRFGTPEDLMYLIDYLHQFEIGIIFDWVPSHFPCDEHGLAFFDGTHLYEHADPRQGFHPDWTSAIFNYSRNEVWSFLISSAFFWLDKYHVDGLRVDGVASMLYLDYSRKEGEWVPNEYGGRENLAAIYFLKKLNEEVYKNFPDVQMIAEESTAWMGVSKPTYLGGLGFGFKWDMGWMHDTLRYFSLDSVYRNYHHNELSFRMIYAFHENFVLPLSHDEVVHGKGSILQKMPGNDWDKFANARLLYGYMFAQPGKKLLFMGNDIGVWEEWRVDKSLDWHLLEFSRHQQLQNWVRDLNHLYRTEPALHFYDCDPKGFEWIDCSDHQHSIMIFLRKSAKEEEEILVIFNGTPMVWRQYRLGVPRLGKWQVIANSDAAQYGGSDTIIGDAIAEEVNFHGRSSSIVVDVPPLAIVFLKLADRS